MSSKSPHHMCVSGVYLWTSQVSDCWLGQSDRFQEDWDDSVCGHFYLSQKAWSSPGTFLSTGEPSVIIVTMLPSCGCELVWWRNMKTITMNIIWILFLKVFRDYLQLCGNRNLWIPGRPLSLLSHAPPPPTIHTVHTVHTHSDTHDEISVLGWFLDSLQEECTKYVLLC